MVHANSPAMNNRKKHIDANIYKTREILLMYLYSYGVKGIAVVKNNQHEAFYCFCPLRGHHMHRKEKTPSFRADVMKKGRQKGLWAWKCFSCGKAGDIYTLIMLAQDVHFPTALRIVLNRYARGFSLPPYMYGMSSDRFQLRLELSQTNKAVSKQ